MNKIMKYLEYVSIQLTTADIFPVLKITSVQSDRWTQRQADGERERSYKLMTERYRTSR